MSGLYIHIPFCRKKCGYCDFPSYEGREEAIGPYLNALKKEAEQYSADPGPLSVTTLYIGGGTPSLLSENQLSFLFSAIKENFSLQGMSEATMELNPESADPGKIRLLKKLGINRLSIGLQSHNSAHLKTLGRIHTTEKFLETYSCARREGFANINIDLIYGIPGQDLQGWLGELSKVSELSPEHISLYPLTIEENTKLHSCGVAVDEDLQASMYECAIEQLSKKGYEQYEISNFSRKNRRCNHNITYWLNKEYAGIGAGAASYLSGKRKKNTPDIDGYISAVTSGRTPCIEEEILEGRKKTAEKIVLGLRMSEGINISAEELLFADRLQNLKSLGLLENPAGNTWRLTLRGKLLANVVFRELL